MATVLRSITRFVPWHGLYEAPSAREATVSLVQWDRCVMVQTPWACLDGTAELTESDLARFLPNSFATAAEAEAEARRRAPFAGTPANEKIRTEVIDARRHYGDLVGTGKVADRYLVSEDAILAIARGERAAPRQPRKAAAGKR